MNNYKNKKLMSGGIILKLFSILMIISANIFKNVELLFNSISQSGSLGIKGKYIEIPLIG